MQIRVEVLIQASPERCFDAHRDLALHVESAKDTGERIVGDRQIGLLELGEVVTFEARHFGFKFRLTSKIVEFNRPDSFVDEMGNGPFKRLRHLHQFEPTDSGTRVVDLMEIELPFGWLGRTFGGPFLKKHMEKFLRKRNDYLKAKLAAGEG